MPQPQSDTANASRSVLSSNLTFHYELTTCAFLPNQKGNQEKLALALICIDLPTCLIPSPTM